MRKHLAAPIAALAATSLLFVFAPAASATHVQCGAVITQDTTLDSDLIDCPPPFAIQISAQGVTLDLGGNTVDGTGPGIGAGSGIRTTFQSPSRGASVVNGHVQEFHFGIHLDDGGDQVVRNVAVTDNDSGVLITDSAGALVEGVTATRNSGGISLSTVVDPVVRRNHVFGNAAGMGGAGVQNGTLERNSVHDNEFGGLGWTSFERGRIVNNHIVRNGLWGIFLDDSSGRNDLRSNEVVRNGADGILLGLGASGNNLVDNRTNGNGDDGIDIEYNGVPGNALTGNTAFRNGDLGIVAVDGTVDGGGNKARHNGNPDQCTGVTCK